MPNKPNTTVLTNPSIRSTGGAVDREHDDQRHRHQARRGDGRGVGAARLHQRPQRPGRGPVDDEETEHHQRETDDRVQRDRRYAVSEIGPVIGAEAQQSSCVGSFRVMTAGIRCGTKAAPSSVTKPDGLPDAQARGLRRRRSTRPVPGRMSSNCGSGSKQLVNVTFFAVDAAGLGFVAVADDRDVRAFPAELGFTHVLGQFVWIVDVGGQQVRVAGIHLPQTRPGSPCCSTASSTAVRPTTSPGSESTARLPKSSSSSHSQG